jgi:hypothetical protein
MAIKNTKKLVPPGLRYVADNIISKGNILGTSPTQKTAWARGLDIPKGGETIFFAGCGYQYSGALESMMALLRKSENSPLGLGGAMGIATLQKKLGLDVSTLLRKLTVKDKDAGVQPLRDAVRVLQNLDIEFGYLYQDEPCCAGLLYHIGFHQKFQQNAQQLYNTLKSHGVKRIISIVPSCTHTLRTLIPDFLDKFDIEVKHFVEIVLENIDNRQLRFPREARVTFHDPCQLGRFLGLIDEPRQIIRAIDNINLIEPEWTAGEWSTCCGGGGGFEAVFPELSSMLARKRVDELLNTGAEIIVTHCPGCIMQLKAGLRQLKADKVEVLDLAQLIAMSMGV